MFLNWRPRLLLGIMFEASKSRHKPSIELRIYVIHSLFAIIHVIRFDL